VPIPTPGGGWLLSYRQDNVDPAGPDTNEGLRRCIADRVPVGVLRERAPARHPAWYDVLGLALPVRWSDGVFYFESLNPKQFRLSIRLVMSWRPWPAPKWIKRSQPTAMNYLISTHPMLL
jgi:hypothetical protein